MPLLIDDEGARTASSYVNAKKFDGISPLSLSENYRG